MVILSLAMELPFLVKYARDRQGSDGQIPQPISVRPAQVKLLERSDAPGIAPGQGI